MFLNFVYNNPAKKTSVTVIEKNHTWSIICLTLWDFVYFYNYVERKYIR